VKRPWIAYVTAGVIAALAGLAIAGVPSTPAGTTVVIDPPPAATTTTTTPTDSTN
jgi:hypothetical protein